MRRGRSGGMTAAGKDGRSPPKPQDSGLLLWGRNFGLAAAKNTSILMANAASKLNMVEDLDAQLRSMVGKWVRTRESCLASKLESMQVTSADGCPLHVTNDTGGIGITGKNLMLTVGLGVDLTQY